MRRIVVLPEPDGPISASFSPGITSIDRSSSTFSAPKLFAILSIRMIGEGMRTPSCAILSLTMRKATNHVNW